MQKDLEISVKRLFIILILVSLFSGSCKKDEEENPVDDSMILEEYFDESSKWPEFDNESAAAFIEDGKYYFEHKTEDPNRSYSMYYYRDLKNIYTMETSISLLEGSEDFRYGIIYFFKDNYNHHYLYINHNRFFIGYVYNYNYHVICDYTESDAINIDEKPNIIKMVINSKHVDFFINNTKVYEYDVSFFTGDEFGYKFASKGKVAIDYLKVFRHH